ncbi:2,3-diketo-L-gulonate TRAP transporter small permease protein YiaM [Neomoorella glycerini]|uniref:2,3-diketo-L-gulonate TRAP transporter small permease protein YiaM n=1 Tax=Neomoorella glycerini TaxID=55779 RepID=A0A6I5ZVG4_9FIRM|nr:TRAP transporter small permease [Moorella glycerini]QGP93695.1 2,3-diketo-L-gulonate TRAP transporter small permease protein YiaM [Moorella glycerini]
MAKLYNQLKHFVIKVLEYLIIICVGTAIASAFLQVIFRYVLNNSLTWSEELTRYLFIWVVFMAAPVALVRKMHMGVDIIFNRLPGKIKIFTEAIIELCVAIFAITLVNYGFKLTSIAMNQPSPAMRIPMGYVYLAIPLGSLFLTWFALDGCLQGLRNLLAPVTREEVYKS